LDYTIHFTMQARSSRAQHQDTLPGGQNEENNDINNGQYRSRSTGQKEEKAGDIQEPKERGFAKVGTEYVGSETESMHSLRGDEIAGRAVAMMKGTPRNSEAVPSSSAAQSDAQKEGGQAEGQDGAGDAAGGLLALSLQKVRARAAQ